MSNATALSNIAISQVFSALADDNRLRIFEAIVTERDICVSELADKVGMSVSGAWQHLKVLERAGLIEEYKTGRKTCHQLVETNFNQEIISLINKR